MKRWDEVNLDLIKDKKNFGIWGFFDDRRFYL